MIDRYISGAASTDELLIFRELLKKGELDGFLEQATADNEGAKVVPINGRSLRTSVLRKYSVAAIIIGLVGAGAFYFIQMNRHAKRQEPMVANLIKNDVAPGGNHAILILSDGSHISLDSLGTGSVLSKGGVQVTKVGAGSLSCKTSGGAQSDLLFNTIETPAGGQYHLTLPDGTQVWLNSLSSLKFPVSFEGARRTVEVTGEAYLAVAKDKDRPFDVKVNGLDIAVLGTEFNVNAYSDEPVIRTTLVNGSVRLNRPGATLQLKAGEAASTKGKNELSLDKSPNIEQALAWKNGYFSFDGADIKGVMRQLARWYNIEVKYTGDPGSRLFGGQIGRNLNLSEVLAGFSASNIHFKLEGNILTVYP